MLDIRSVPKPTAEVSLSLSSVFDESQQTFQIFGVPTVSLLLSPKRVCDTQYVVVAPSAPANTLLRNRLRDQLRGKVFLLFILARPNTIEGDRLLREESTKEGDILQGDFKDSYRTVPYKTIMAFIWIKRSGLSI